MASGLDLLLSSNISEIQQKSVITLNLKKKLIFVEHLQSVRFPYFRYPEYDDTEKRGLRSFLVSLANATYGTFKDVPVDDRISPDKYLDHVNAIRVSLDYTVTDQLGEQFSSVGLTDTTTELGICYSFNGDISPYNNYRSVSAIAEPVGRRSDKTFRSEYEIKKKRS